MRAAVIGCGRWGKKLTACFGEHFNVGPVANSKTDLNTIWQDKNIEAVVIATPIDTHYGIALDALHSGKHTFCEKPLTLHVEEAQELRALAGREGKVLVTDYIMTFSPWLRELAASCGKVGYFHALRWRLDPRPAQSVHYTLTCHDLAVLDMFRSLDTLNFRTINRNIRTGTIVGRANDFHAVLSASLDLPKKETLIAIKHSKGANCYPSEPGFEANLLDAACVYFKACIDGQAKPNIDRAVRVTDALERAIRPAARNNVSGA